MCIRDSGWGWESALDIGDYGDRCFACEHRCRRSEAGALVSAGDDESPSAREAAGEVDEIFRRKLHLSAVISEIGGRRRFTRCGERLTERKVQMDGAAGCIVGDRPGAEGEGMSRCCRRLVGDADVVEQPHCVSVEVGLIDRLGCCGAAKLRRSVRCEHEERDSGEGCLDDGGEIVRCRRAGGADEDGREAALFRDAESEETCRSFIKGDVGHDACLSIERQGKRGAAGTGRYDGVPQPEVCERSGESRRQCCCMVHVGEVTAVDAGASVILTPCIEVLCDGGLSSWSCLPPSCSAYTCPSSRLEQGTPTRLPSIGSSPVLQTATWASRSIWCSSPSGSASPGLP